jgi:hypothetical protein
VSKAIVAEDQVGATLEKTKLEESQRNALRYIQLQDMCLVFSMNFKNTLIFTLKVWIKEIEEGKM